MKQFQHLIEYYLKANMIVRFFSLRPTPENWQIREGKEQLNYRGVFSKLDDTSVTRVGAILTSHPRLESRMFLCRANYR